MQTNNNNQINTSIFQTNQQTANNIFQQQPQQQQQQQTNIFQQQQSQTQEKKDDEQQQQEQLQNLIKVKREEQRINIRKQNTDQQLNQKRKMLMNRNFNGQQVVFSNSNNILLNNQNNQQNNQQSQNQNQNQQQNQSQQQQNLSSREELKKQIKYVVNQEQQFLELQQKKEQEAHDRYKCQMDLFQTTTYEHEEDAITLYQKISSSFYDKNTTQLIEYIGYIFEFLTVDETQIMENNVPCLIKCQYLDILTTILQDITLMVQNPNLCYTIICILSNICCSKDIYVEVFMQHDPIICKILINLAQEFISIEPLNTAFNQVDQDQFHKNNQQIKFLEAHINQTLDNFKVVEAILFCFSNLIGNNDHEFTLQVKALFMNESMIPLLIEIAQNMDFVQDHIKFFTLQQIDPNYNNQQDSGNYDYEMEKIKFNQQLENQTQNHTIINNFYKTYTWFVSQFIRPKASKAWRPLMDSLKPILLKVIDKYWKDSTFDEDIVQNCLWAFFYTQSLSKYYLEEFCRQFEKRRIAKIIHSITNPQAQFSYLCLRIISNILSSTDQMTQSMIDMSILDQLYIAFESPNQRIRSEIAWSISNICAASPVQIQFFLHHKLFGKCIHKAKTDAIPVQKELLMAFGNLLSSCTIELLQNVLFKENNYLDIIMHSLMYHDQQVRLNTLDGLEQCLYNHKDIYTSSGQNLMVIEFDRYNLTNYLEDLQNDQDEKIYTKVNNIIETYFINNYDEQEEEEYMY